MCIHSGFLKDFLPSLVNCSTIFCRRSVPAEKKTDFERQFSRRTCLPPCICFRAYPFLFPFSFAVIKQLLKRGRKILITENYEIFLCNCTDTSIAHNSMLFVPPKTFVSVNVVDRKHYISVVLVLPVQSYHNERCLFTLLFDSFQETTNETTKTK